jgi:TRAP-type C4-dicarboxylate transport system substrate-binding protein
MKHFPSLAATALIAAAAFVSPAGPAAAKTLITSCWLPPLNPANDPGYAVLAETVEAATDLKFRHTAGSALLPPGEHLSGLRDGVAAVTCHAGTFTPSDLPEDSLLSFMAMRYTKPMALVGAYAEFWMTDLAMLARQNEGGFVVIAPWATPAYSMICNTPIRTVEDMKGKRIRSTVAAVAGWIESVGAIPVAVPSSDSFQGLDRGQLDCTTIYPSGMTVYSLWDVASSITILPELSSYFAGWMAAVNADTWRELSTEERVAMLDGAVNGIVGFQFRDLELETKVLAEAEANSKVEVIMADEAMTASAVAFAQDDALALALTAAQDRFGMSEAEAQGVIDRFDAIYTRWATMVDDVETPEQLTALLHSELYDKIDPATYGVSR